MPEHSVRLRCLVPVSGLPGRDLRSATIELSMLYTARMVLIDQHFSDAVRRKQVATQMSTKRLRAWRSKFGANLTFGQLDDGRWVVNAGRTGAIAFTFEGADLDVEKAAEKVIAQLEAIGEEVPDA
jgi:hypothetical protein